MWQIDKEIKEELEDSATQNIEEFDTQDIVFDDDFSNDAAPALDKAPAETVKAEIKKEDPIPSTSNTITDVAEEFLNDDFEIFDTKKPTELKPLTSTWISQMGANQTSAAVQIDSSQLPLQTNENGDKVLKFYWLDAWEDRFVKPGVVYLFGKVYANPLKKQDGCVTCCLVVKNVDRKLFLLPREYVSTWHTKLFPRVSRVRLKSKKHPYKPYNIALSAALPTRSELYLKKGSINMSPQFMKWHTK